MHGAYCQACAIGPETMRVARPHGNPFKGLTPHKILDRTNKHRLLCRSDIEVLQLPPSTGSIACNFGKQGRHVSGGSLSAMCTLSGAKRDFCKEFVYGHSHSATGNPPFSRYAESIHPKLMEVSCHRIGSELAQSTS